MPIAASPDASLHRRLGTLAAGLPLVSVGVALTIRAEIGVAPYDVLSTGIVALTGVGIGIAAMLLPLAFVVVGLLLRSRPGAGTVLAVLLVGPVLGLVLDALPAEMRTSVVLVALQGMSHGEAAVVQKCSEGTVAWRMHEARVRLAAAMTPDAIRPRRPLSSDFQRLLGDLGLPVVSMPPPVPGRA